MPYFNKQAQLEHPELRGKLRPNCSCGTVMGVIIKEDPNKLWRCARCFAPATNEFGAEFDVYPPPYSKIIWSVHILRS